MYWLRLVPRVFSPATRNPGGPTPLAGPSLTTVRLLLSRAAASLCSPGREPKLRWPPNRMIIPGGATFRVQAMAGTYTNLLFHIVFSTKERRRLITPSIEDELHKYIGGIVRNSEGDLLEANGDLDHRHLLVVLKPKYALSDWFVTSKPVPPAGSTIEPGSTNSAGKTDLPRSPSASHKHRASAATFVTRKTAIAESLTELNSSNS